MNNFRQRFEAYQKADKKANLLSMAAGIIVLGLLMFPLIWYTHPLCFLWRLLCIAVGFIVIGLVTSLIIAFFHSCLLRYFYKRIIKKTSL